MVADNHLSFAALNYKTGGEGQSRVTVEILNARYFFSVGVDKVRGS